MNTPTLPSFCSLICPLTLPTTSSSQIDLTKAEVSRIFLKYDLDGDGCLQYSEYLRLVKFTPSSGTDRDRASGRGSSKEGEIDDLMDRIRRKLEDSMGSGPAAARRVRETFSDIDTDGTSYLDKRDFEGALSRLKVDVSPHEIDMLGERFGTGGRGRIEYLDFHRQLNLGSRSVEESKQ